MICAVFVCVGLAKSIISLVVVDCVFCVSRVAMYHALYFVILRCQIEIRLQRNLEGLAGVISVCVGDIGRK